MISGSVAGCGGLNLTVAPAIDTLCTEQGKPPVTEQDAKTMSVALARWLDVYEIRWDTRCGRHQ